MMPWIASRNIPVVLIYTDNSKCTPPDAPHDDIVDQVWRELTVLVEAAVDSGIPRWNIILDVGLETLHPVKKRLEVIGRFHELRSREELGGVAWVLGTAWDQGALGGDNLWETAGVVAACVGGKVDLVRVRDVLRMSQVVKTCDRIWTD
jgi:dihydroneopterin aldolase / 2-amino-4-hydroxy-6-hydroxymethyldihydropteridine diphosphokinase / dihydropteroate synthase